MVERNQIATNVNQLNEKQRKSSANDKVAVGVALVLFWPAAALVGMTPDQSAQLAQAKGNFDAIETQMRKKGCPLPQAPEPETEADPTEPV
jgi:hypothetical protein